MQVARRTNYALSNPIKLIDPTGMGPADWVMNKGTGEITYDSRVNSSADLASNGYNPDDYEYIAPGYELTDPRFNSNVVLGENGNYTENGESKQVLDQAPTYIDRFMTYLSSINPFSDSGSETFYNVTRAAGLGHGGRNSFYRFGDTVREVDLSLLTSYGRGSSPGFMDFLGDALSLGNMGSPALSGTGYSLPSLVASNYKNPNDIIKVQTDSGFFVQYGTFKAAGWGYRTHSIQRKDSIKHDKYWENYNDSINKLVR